MAKGSFKSSLNTSAGSNFARYIEVEWQSTNDEGGNTSTIAWDAYSRTLDSNTTRWVEAVKIVITIDGQPTTVVGSTPVKLTKDKLLGSGSVIVSHNADGRKTVSVSITAQIYEYGTDNSTYSGTITMTPNPAFDLTVSAREGSSATVNRTFCSGLGGTGNLSPGEKKLYYGDILKITFIPDTNYEIARRVVNSSTFTSGNSYVVTSDVSVFASAIPACSKILATDAIIGHTSVITVSRYNDAHTHTITYSFGDLTGTICEKSSDTSIAWTVPTSFYNQIPDSKSDVCELTIITYDGDNVVGSSTGTMTASTDDSSYPSVYGEVIDTNSTTLALTGDNSILVKYKSTLKCTIRAEAKNGASIVSRMINGHNVGTSMTMTGSSADSFVFATTDSRGYTASTTVVPTIVAYRKLTCNPTIVRMSPTSNTLHLNVKGEFYNGSFGAATNTLKLEYRYREPGGAYGSWTQIDTTDVVKGVTSYIGENIQLSDEFDYRKNYVIQIRATDGSETVTLSTAISEMTVQKGIPVYDWGENDFNVNVELKLKGVNIIDIVYPVNSYYMSKVDILPDALAELGEWELMQVGIQDVYAWMRVS